MKELSIQPELKVLKQNIFFKIAKLFGREVLDDETAHLVNKEILAWKQEDWAKYFIVKESFLFSELTKGLIDDVTNRVHLFMAIVAV